MAPSVSKEELMRNTDSVVWGFNSGNSTPKLGIRQRICEKIWSVLNSRACNVVIVVFVFAEGIVILSALLISLRVVQDPEWRFRNMNCSQNISSFPNELSPKLRKAKDVFTYSSLTLLSAFVIEIILRIFTGKTRFIVQGIEVFDAIVVLIAFGLDVTFFLTPTKNGMGKEAAILIILLRLWRINQVFKSIIKSSKAKLGNIINSYQKEKVQSDHKIDLLILKVEDLEHEVAYLKEKLKKTEREPLFVKRRRTKDYISSNTPKSTTIAINIEPNTCPNTTDKSSNHRESWYHPPLIPKGSNDKMTTFAENAATIIVDEALLLVSHIWAADSVFVRPEAHRSSKPAPKLRRRPDGSIESGYGSVTGSMNESTTWNRIREHYQTDEDHRPVPLNVIRNTLKCPESSPESGYGSGGSHNLRNSSSSPRDNETESANLSSGHSKQSNSVFLFPESSSNFKPSDCHDVQLTVLDEVTEIERVKHVEFNPYRHDKSIPMTSL